MDTSEAPALLEPEAVSDRRDEPRDDSVQHEVPVAPPITGDLFRAETLNFFRPSQVEVNELNQHSPFADATFNTPLPPSVEKAYYRKCIELKRRLNEVEAANDEAKIRRVRLDRGIMKMRLERAFLLDELRRRMEHNVDGSEGSADEGMATPPTDRPHRDKRRRPLPPAPSAPPPGGSSHAHQPATYAFPSAARTPSQSEANAPPPGGMPIPLNSREQDNSYAYPPQQAPPLYAAQPVPIPASPYSTQAQGREVNGSNLDGPDERDRERDHAPTNRTASATGEALSAGPAIQEDANGDRKMLSPTSAGHANAESA